MYATERDQNQYDNQEGYHEYDYGDSEPIFSTKNSKSSLPEKIEAKTPVNIKMTKINPKSKIVMAKEVELGEKGDEVTAFRFTVDEKGDVIDVNFLEKKLATAPRGDDD